MRSVGLEIGDGFLRAVEVDGGPKGANIRKFVQVPVTLTEGHTAEEDLVEAIDAMFREHSLPRGNVSISIDSTEAVLRELSMPVTSDDQLRKTVKFEFEHHVHNKSVDDMIVDFYKIDKRDKSTLVLAAGIPKPVIEHRLEMCRRARIDPVCVDLDLFALFNGAAGASAFEGKPAVLLIQLHPRFTKLLAVDEGRLRFVRNIRVTQATRAAVPAGEGIAESLSGTYQVSGPAALAEVLNKEISRSLLSHPLKQAVTHLIVAGAAEQVAAVIAPLQEAASIPTEAFNPDPEQAELVAATVALGLAFHGIGIDQVGTDFRKEEFKFERRFETVKKSAFLCLCMMSVLLGLIALYYHNRHREYVAFRNEIVNRQLESVTKVYKELEPDKEPPAVDDPVLEAKKLLKKQETEVGKGDHPLPVSALQHWKLVFEQLTGFDYLRVQNLNINLERNSIQLRGEVSKTEVAERILNQLKTVPGYSIGQTGRMEPVGANQTYDWTIIIK